MTREPAGFGLYFALLAVFFAITAEGAGLVASAWRFPIGPALCLAPLTLGVLNLQQRVGWYAALAALAVSRLWTCSDPGVLTATYFTVLYSLRPRLSLGLVLRTWQGCSVPLLLGYAANPLHEVDVLLAVLCVQPLAMAASNASGRIASRAGRRL